MSRRRPKIKWALNNEIDQNMLRTSEWFRQTFPQFPVFFLRRRVPYGCRTAYNRPAHHILQLPSVLQWISFQCQSYCSSLVSKSALQWKFIETPMLAAFGWSRPSPATSISDIQKRRRKAISLFRKFYKQQQQAVLMDMIISPLQVRIWSILKRKNGVKLSRYWMEGPSWPSRPSWHTGISCLIFFNPVLL